MREKFTELKKIGGHMTLTQKFIYEISKIKKVEYFFGVARILKVSLMNADTHEPRDFTDIFSDVCTNFDKSTKSRKKELLRILHQANKEDAVDANRAEDSSADVSNKEVQ